MTDSVQNLLLALRLNSENTEDAPPPILRVRVPGVDSAASRDGACCDEGGKMEGKCNTIRTRRMIRSSQRIGDIGRDQGLYLREQQQEEERDHEDVGGPPAGGHLAGRGAACSGCSTETGELRSDRLEARTPAAPGGLGCVFVARLLADRSPS